MKPISVQWTEEVTLPEARAVLEGVVKAAENMLVVAARAGIGLHKAQIRPFGTWYIPGLAAGTPYWSTLWYVGQSLDAASGRIVGPRFIDTIRQEPWQRAGAHYDVAIVHYDLLDAPESMLSEGGAGYVLSSTARNLAAVISVNRLRRIGDDATFRRALTRLTVHSFGHVLEAPAPDRTRATLQSYGDRHCTNRCVMRHPESLGELLEFARAEADAQALFCDLCASDILDHAIRNHFGVS